MKISKGVESHCLTGRIAKHQSVSMQNLLTTGHGCHHTGVREHADATPFDRWLAMTGGLRNQGLPAWTTPMWKTPSATAVHNRATRPDATRLGHPMDRANPLDDPLDWLPASVGKWHINRKRAQTLSPRPVVVQLASREGRRRH